MSKEGGSSRINSTGERATKQLYAYFLYHCVGSDRPSLKDLYDHVVNNFAAIWKDLGVQLLPPDQEKMLDIIAANHPNDVVSCCKCVFKEWLEKTSGATWNQLIQALRSPSVQLPTLADQLQQMLFTECKIYQQLAMFTD